jgi:hypothetical protein
MDQVKMTWREDFTPIVPTIVNKEFAIWSPKLCQCLNTIDMMNNLHHLWLYGREICSNNLCVWILVGEI